MCGIKFQIINILLKMRRISKSTTNDLEFLFFANLLPKPKTILNCKDSPFLTVNEKIIDFFFFETS